MGWMPDPTDLADVMPWPVVADPRDVHPPCILLAPQRAEPVGGCGWEQEIRVVAVAPGPDHGGAAAALWDTAAPALALLPHVTSIEQDTWGDLPCLTATTTRLLPPTGD